MSTQDRVKARMEGAAAALRGDKLGANTYPEESDLHFEWLDGWVVARMEMRKRPDSEAQDSPNSVLNEPRADK